MSKKRSVGKPMTHVPMMQIYVAWRSATVTLEKVTPDLENLSKTFSNRFIFKTKEKRDHWHQVIFEMPNVVMAINVSDLFMTDLRGKNAHGLIRNFEGDQANNLNLILHRMDEVEAAARKAISAIESSKLRWVPFMSEQFEAIRLTLERSLTRRSGLLR
jgi:hypothetical protein